MTEQFVWEVCLWDRWPMHGHYAWEHFSTESEAYLFAQVIDGALHYWKVGSINRLPFEQEFPEEALAKGWGPRKTALEALTSTWTDEDGAEWPRYCDVVDDMIYLSDDDEECYHRYPKDHKNATNKYFLELYEEYLSSAPHMKGSGGRPVGGV